jgi:hypothetical protein
LLDCWKSCFHGCSTKNFEFYHHPLDFLHVWLILIVAQSFQWCIWYMYFNSNIYHSKQKSLNCRWKLSWQIYEAINNRVLRKKMMQLKGPNEIHRETTGEQTKHIPLGIPTAWVSKRVIPIMTSKEKDEQLRYWTINQLPVRCSALSPLIHNSPGWRILFSPRVHKNINAEKVSFQFDRR